MNTPTPETMDLAYAMMARAASHENIRRTGGTREAYERDRKVGQEYGRAAAAVYAAFADDDDRLERELREAAEMAEILWIEAKKVLSS